ncbi:hypothetical protein P9E76_22000 [Schinkia azotoformans]|uniref:Uncharacterized protein n=1 Tax=Schinkia azotoformans LMG 9581 TaxID=1131731 RepID=K6DFP6_SCHAZ|nr:hypothetical protein [Schinkia azotoformans]EKN67134.1 hypothetical protein BAZO_10331 [Schinkia azotoformans LMG 9581]MEC1641160.1 hypothetical protein [Schinkia azotoformans]MEC1947666.1 hypothetical protein [Schinkia azotoformans]
MVGIEMDDITAKKLLEIAGRHYKLVYELGNRSTSKERRIEIMEEIQSLRIRRDTIIEGLKKDQIK